MIHLLWHGLPPAAVAGVPAAPHPPTIHQPASPTAVPPPFTMNHSTIQPLTVRHGRFHPTTWLNLMNYGQNGRSPPHRLAKLDELWGERPFPPTTLLNLINCGENGRFPPHLLAKLDELWAERPFPPHPLENLMNCGQNGRSHPPPG